MNLQVDDVVETLGFYPSFHKIEKHNYHCIKSRRKIKKNGRVKFEYEVRSYSWDYYTEKYVEKITTMTSHAFNQFRDKQFFKVHKKAGEEMLDVLLAKHMLAS
jgi:hypothetical protein